MKFWKQKHEQLQKKRAKTIETKRGPNTYEPIVANTFHSLKTLNKVVKAILYRIDQDGVMDKST